MKLKLMFAAALMLALTGLAGCQQQSADKIAIVDPAEVFQSCEACVAGGDYLRGMGQQLQGRLAEIQKPADDSADDGALKKAQEEFMQMQEHMSGEQRRIVEKLNEEFSAVLDEYRAENGISVVLNKQQALSYGDNADITKAVVEAMNARNIDLGIVSETAEPAATAEETAGDNAESAE
ncbi:hypothetical protein JCM16814_27060 [Desulfobaculum senezii]|jgi:outer membrane protein